MKHVEINCKVAGFYKLEAVRPDGSKRLLADWFQNVITDIGLETLGTNHGIPNSSSSPYCSVGTGSTTPAVTDTALAAFLAATNNKTGNTTGAQSSAPFYGWRRITWRFAAGTATGNISELGVGRSPGGANLFSRALVKDGGGSPTTVTVLIDEALDVTYEIRLYPMLDDVAFNVTIAGVVYSFTLRAYKVTDVTSWGNAIGLMAHLNEPFSSLDVVQAKIEFSNGTMTTIDGTTITGSKVSFTSEYGSSRVSAPSYIAGSLETYFTLTLGLSEGNLSGGYTAGSFGLSSLGRYQFSVTPAIPKNDTKNFTMTYKMTWNRL